MPQVMEAQISEPGPLKRRIPLPTEIEHEAASRSRKHAAARLALTYHTRAQALPACLPKSAQSLMRRCIHRDASALARFRRAHEDGTAHKVDVVPSEFEQLAAAHSAMDRNRDERREPRRQ